MNDLDAKIYFEFIRIYSELLDTYVEVDDDLPQLTYNDL